MLKDFPAMVDAKWERVAVLPLICPQSNPVKRANAGLMSAAPEMLEVLEWLLEEFDRRELDGNAVFCLADLAQVRTVIRKARGEA